MPRRKSIAIDRPAGRVIAETTTVSAGLYSVDSDDCRRHRGWSEVRVFARRVILLRSAVAHVPSDDAQRAGCPRLVDESRQDLRVPTRSDAANETNVVNSVPYLLSTAAGRRQTVSPVRLQYRFCTSQSLL